MCAILAINTPQHYTFGSENGDVRNFGDFGNQQYTLGRCTRFWQSTHHNTTHLVVKMVMSAILTVNTTQHYTFDGWEW
jgi:hypothetical protein